MTITGSAGTRSCWLCHGKVWFPIFVSMLAAFALLDDTVGVLQVQGFSREVC